MHDSSLCTLGIFLFWVVDDDAFSCAFDSFCEMFGSFCSEFLVLCLFVIRILHVCVHFLHFNLSVQIESEYNPRKGIFGTKSKKRCVMS